MKDFSSLLQDSSNFSDKGTSVDQREEAKVQNLDRIILRDRLLKYAAPIMLSIITSPMTVGSIFLQVTPRALFDPIQEKLQTQKLQNMQVNPKFISNGIYGDNKIFKPQEVKGYSQAFRILGQQGLPGFYKGNMTQLILTAINSSLRNVVFANMARHPTNEYTQNAVTIAACSLIDMITSPLMAIQTRLVLQNRNPNFRTYRSPLDIIKRVPVRQLFKGALIHIPKNLAMIFSWVNLIKQSPIYSFILSTVLAHVTTYPFTTIIRKMQAQSGDAMMLKDGYKNSLDCAKDIWSSQGIRGFYRGFLCYSIVHAFTISLMVQINMRSGFFSPN